MRGNEFSVNQELNDKSGTGWDNGGGAFPAQSKG